MVNISLMIMPKFILMTVVINSGMAFVVVSIMNGHLADQEWHLTAWNIHFQGEYSMPTMKIVIGNLIRMNKITNGLISFQIARGVMRRDHAFNAMLKPQLVMTDKTLPRLSKLMIDPVKVITVPDQRWQRRDIKTLQLLPNCMAKTKAIEAGAYEALMVDHDGLITEGSSSNAWIVTHEGELITRPATYDILSGITRKAILDIAAKRNLKILERGFSVEEAENAAEVFVSSATSLVTPVYMIDDVKIGNGDTGPVALALRQAYFDHVRALAAE